MTPRFFIFCIFTFIFAPFTASGNSFLPLKLLRASGLSINLVNRIVDAILEDRTEEALLLLKRVSHKQLIRAEFALERESLQKAGTSHPQFLIGDHEGVRFLHLACLAGNKTIISYLLSRRMDPREVTTAGWNPASYLLWNSERKNGELAQQEAYRLFTSRGVTETFPLALQHSKSNPTQVRPPNFRELARQAQTEATFSHLDPQAMEQDPLGLLLFHACLNRDIALIARLLEAGYIVSPSHFFALGRGDSISDQLVQTRHSYLQKTAQIFELLIHFSPPAPPAPSAQDNVHHAKALQMFERFGEVSSIDPKNRFSYVRAPRDKQFYLYAYLAGALYDENEQPHSIIKALRIPTHAYAPTRLDETNAVLRHWRDELPFLKTNLHYLSLYKDPATDPSLRYLLKFTTDVPKHGYLESAQMGESLTPFLIHRTHRLDELELAPFYSCLRGDELTTNELLAAGYNALPIHYFALGRGFRESLNLGQQNSDKYGRMFSNLRQHSQVFPILGSGPDRDPSSTTLLWLQDSPKDLYHLSFVTGALPSDDQTAIDSLLTRMSQLRIDPDAVAKAERALKEGLGIYTLAQGQ